MAARIGVLIAGSGPNAIRLAALQHHAPPDLLFDDSPSQDPSLAPPAAWLIFSPEDLSTALARMTPATRVPVLLAWPPDEPCDAARARALHDQGCVTLFDTRGAWWPMREVEGTRLVATLGESADAAHGTERDAAQSWIEVIRCVLAQGGATRRRDANSVRATIVVPLLRQRDAWLRDCVLSALHQTVRVDVVVVTSPETPEGNRALLRHVSAEHPGLRVIEQPPMSGFAGAINEGFRQAAAPRVLLLLSDDWLEPHAVESCAALDADIVCAGHAVHGANAGTVYWTRVPQPAAYASLPTLEARAAFLSHPLLFRRSSVLAAGGVDPSVGLTGADDYDLPWSLLERGATVAIAPEVLYHYRDHDGERLTLRDKATQVQSLLRVLHKHAVPDDERERLVAAHAEWYGEPCHVVMARRRARA